MASTTGVEDWADQFDALVADLDLLSLREMQARCALGKSKLEAAEVRRLAAEVGADGDDSRARRQAKAGGARSRASARKAAARAKAVAANKDLADDLESGDLSEEKLDIIADAMKNDASAATDPAFLEQVKNGTADAAHKAGKERQQRRQGGENDHERQHRLRRAIRHHDHAADLAALTLAGDGATISELWRAIRLREKQLREADGGRDMAAVKHPRTYDQRLFDAAVQLLLGTGDGAGLAARPSAVVGITVDGAAESLGDGPIDDATARRILERAGMHVALIDSLTGQPLWLSRASRHASAGQFLALVVRDLGCVLCGADWIGCEAHHLTPWTAPAQGETDIDKLALLCVDCHHQLHGERLTLERLGDGTWKTRPATADELPADQQSPRHESDRCRAAAAPADITQPSRLRSRPQSARRAPPERPSASADADDEPH